MLLSKKKEISIYNQYSFKTALARYRALLARRELKVRMEVSLEKLLEE